MTCMRRMLTCTDVLMASLLFCLFLVSMVTSQSSDEGWCSDRWDTQRHAVATLGLLKMDSVMSIRFYFCHLHEVDIILWTALDNNRHRVRQKWTFNPPEKPSWAFFNLEDYNQTAIPLGQDDRIGIYSSSNMMPLGGKFYAVNSPPVQTRGLSSRVLPSLHPLNTALEVGDIVQFVDLTYPYVLQMNVCNKTNCPTPTQPRSKTPSDGDNSGCGLDDLLRVAGQTVIQTTNGILPKDKVCYVDLAVCSDDAPITLQLWHKRPDRANTFTLYWQQTVDLPEDVAVGEIFRVNLTTWPIIGEDDYLGYYVDSTPQGVLPIAVISPDDLSFRDKFVRVDRDGPYDNDEDQTVTNIAYPYSYKVQMIHTDECQIETTQAPTTQGLTPKSSQPLGSTSTTDHSSPDNSIKTTTKNSKETTKDVTDDIKKTTTESDGLRTSTEIKQGTFGPTIHPYINSTINDDPFSTIASVVITSMETNYPLPTAIYTTTELSLLPRGLPGPAGTQGRQGLKGDTGDIGVSGPQGVKGDGGLLGMPGPGPKGHTGNRGPSGEPGDVGEMGIRGKTGLSGDEVAELAAALREECKCDGLLSPNLILGLVVWAVLLTLLVVILLIFASRDVKREERYNYSESIR